MNVNGLDPTDVGILNLIQENSRLTNKEIAWKTNKSLSAIQVRIRRLQEAGIIKKFVTLLDRNKINKEMAVFTVIKIKDYGNKALTDFQQHITVFEEVMECYHMSGTWDFILKIVVRDMGAYNTFILEKLSIAPNIGSVESFFVISESKYETGFKLKSKS
jgi:Lrp/AsnC family leucine-responsive transcriptional regulator